MIARSFKGKLLVFSVFFLGIVSGVFATNVWETRVNSAPIPNDVKTADRAKKDMDTFYTYVGMTPEQRTQASKIVEDSKPEFKKLSEQMQAMRKQTQGQIRMILTDEQKKKYDEFNEEQKKKFEARRSKPHVQP